MTSRTQKPDFNYPFQITEQDSGQAKLRIILFRFTVLLLGHLMKLEIPLSVGWSCSAVLCCSGCGWQRALSLWVWAVLLFCFYVTQRAFRGSDSKFVCGKFHPTDFLLLLKALSDAASVRSWCLLVEGWALCDSWLKCPCMENVFHVALHVFISALILGRSAAVGGLNPASQIYSA